MKFVVTYIFLLSTSLALAQSTKNIFLEIGGSGGLGSVNYESMFPCRHNPHHDDNDSDNFVCDSPFFLRTGFSVSPIDRNNGWALVFPMMINVFFMPVIGHPSDLLEFGAGFAPTITTKGAYYLRSPLMIGYRREKADRKFFYRIDYTPILSYIVDFQWEHWAGISIGYRLI